MDYSRIVEGLILSGGFKKELAGADFDVAVSSIVKAIETKRGIIFTGNCGSGKTMLLDILFSKFTFKKNVQKIWIDCADPSTSWILNPRENNRISDLYNQYVFIDDFGAEVRMEYGRRTDSIGEFIRMYHLRGTERLFISTNLDSKALLDTYDERVVDRIMEMCVVAKFSGKSKRERVVVK